METHNGLWTGVFIVSATNINYTPTAPSTTPPHMHTPPHFSPCLNELQNASDSLSFMILLKWHCCSFKELHTEAGISLCFHLCSTSRGSLRADEQIAGAATQFAPP